MMTPADKLENCEVCAKEKAKYTCPKCEVRTCNLTCVNIHKKELNCDGIRDKTKFVPLSEFTDLDLLSDYRMLEEVGRSVDQLQRDELKKFTRFGDLPPHLFKMRQAAARSNTRLEFMPSNFSRRRQNTTFFNWKTGQLFWRIEWLFPQAENTKWITQRALETHRLAELVESILDPMNSSDLTSDDMDQIKFLSDKLQYYRSSGLNGLKVLLKAEKVRRSDSRFYELDVAESLRENLSNKTIIEFPTIYVVPRDHLDMYEIIDSDDEEVTATMENWKSRRKNVAGKSGAGKKEKTVNFFFNDDTSDSEAEMKK